MSTYVASLLLVAMPFVTSSFLLVAMPGATSSVLAPRLRYISATTLCYLVGVLAAAWRLRWSQIHGMLSREDGGLEDYARSRQKAVGARKNEKQVACFSKTVGNSLQRAVF